MRRDRRRRTPELLDHRAVFELLEDVARLAGHGKAREPRAARADAPARNRHREPLDARGDCFEIDAAPRQHGAEVIVVGGKVLLQARVVLCDQLGIDWRAWCHKNLARTSSA